MTGAGPLAVNGAEGPTWVVAAPVSIPAGVLLHCGHPFPDAGDPRVDDLGALRPDPSRAVDLGWCILRRQRADHDLMVTRGARSDRAGTARPSDVAATGRPSDAESRPVLRVLRISNSGVVTAWRERERLLRADGVDLTLVTAERWEEGGSMVSFTADGDDFVVPSPDPWPPSQPLRLRSPAAVAASSAFGPVGPHRHARGAVRAGGGRGAGPLLAAPARIPFLFSSAQNIDKRYPPPFRWFERWSLQRAAGAYGVQRRGGSNPPPQGSPRGVRPAAAGSGRGPVRPGRTPRRLGALRVGFVGRLIPHKGVDVLLEAVARDARMLDVDSTAPVPRRSAGGALPPTGHRRPGDVPRVRRRVGHPRHVPARSTSWPSPRCPMPGWLEQFGRVVVEAQASGIPVVASASGALPDVVGEDGLLVPPGDAARPARRPGRLLDEPGLWARLRAAGLAACRPLLVGGGGRATS